MFEQYTCKGPFFQNITLSTAALWPADADKRGYKAYFEQLLSLVRRGGVIAVDNILWCAQGHITACVYISGAEPKTAGCSLHMFAGDLGTPQLACIDTVGLLSPKGKWRLLGHG